MYASTPKIGTIVIGTVVASIAVLANLGTIYDNACKYIVACNSSPEFQPTVAIICNGRATKLSNGTFICEPATQKADTDPMPSSKPIQSGPRAGKCGKFYHWTAGGCKDARNY